MSHPRSPETEISSTAAGLMTAGGACLAALPLAMWLANRSSPLLLGLAAACCLAAVMIDRRAGEAMMRLRFAVTTPLGLAVALFLIWALVSVSWSHKPTASLRDWGELALPIVFALVVAASRRFRPSVAWVRALAAAIILACLLCIIELASGLSQRAALGVGKLMGFVFNRPAITALVLAIPVVHGLWKAPSGRGLNRGLALAVTAAVAALTLRSESASARLGLVVGALCWLAAAFWPRVSLRVVGLAFVATMLVAPLLGPLAQNYMPPALLKRIPPMTGQARIDIWQSFGEAARAKPLVGAGFGTSATLDQHPVAALVAPERRQLLGVGHPHDMPLQVWVEMGAIGAILAIAIGLLLLARLSRMPAREAAPRLALFTACFAISVVGHGAWQGWWIAVLGASILWFSAHDDVPQGADHG